jgi:hypothetical protein
LRSAELFTDLFCRIIYWFVLQNYLLTACMKAKCINF